MIWQQSWTAKSDYSRKYSDVIFTNIDQGSSKRLQMASDYKSKGQIKILGISNCSNCFILAPTFLPFFTSTNNNKSVAWFFWKKWERHWNFDIFDWKLVLSSISQGQSYNQKVALFRCPSDLTNFVKICAFVQSLEVILERSDSLGWELPVYFEDTVKNKHFREWYTCPSQSWIECMGTLTLRHSVLLSSEWVFECDTLNSAELNMNWMPEFTFSQHT